MSEEAQTVKPAAAPVVEDKTFLDLLKSLIGKTVTLVNPESYEDAPVGHRLTTGFYRAKMLSVHKDYVVVATQYVHKNVSKNAEQSKESAQQFIPTDKIKRLSMLKEGERLIHL